MNYAEFPIKQTCAVGSSTNTKSLDCYNIIDEIAGSENVVIVQKTDNSE